MGATDIFLIPLLAIADFCLFVKLQRRRARRIRVQRMMRSVRTAFERDPWRADRPSCCARCSLSKPPA